VSDEARWWGKERGTGRASHFIDKPVAVVVLPVDELWGVGMNCGIMIVQIAQRRRPAVAVGVQDKGVRRRVKQTQAVALGWRDGPEPSVKLTAYVEIYAVRKSLCQ
jgi:hypothetical protein